MFMYKKLIFDVQLIAQETIQQILSRVDIIDIIGSFVKLKKRGTNYLGQCPFHNEKTPSFTVSPSKEIFKCFGCGKSGNTIGFLMEHEKYSYVEAIKWLAAKYNVEIEEIAVSPEVKLQQQVSDSLYIINDFACTFFKQQLMETEEGISIALSYLKERGFRQEIIDRFQLGYAPLDRHLFSNTATKAQFNRELLIKSGIVIEREGQLRDNYSGRIIFPIHNQSGKILGFGARVIKSNEKGPKYINTPENEIYIKSRILYGAYFARNAIDKNDECLLVEGYTDVISLHQAGIENVVASGGTALTPDQLRIIKKYTDNLTIVYDGDSAGIKAALRGLDLALEEGLNVKLVLIPDNEDPDSYVHKVGSQSFRNFIAENKKDFILFQLEIALKEAGNDSAKKSEVVNQLAETLSRMNKTEDFAKRQDYIRQLSGLLKIEENGLNDLVNKYIRQSINKQAPKSNKPDILLPDEQRVTTETDVHDLFIKDELQEKAMVRCLLEFGDYQWAEELKVADYIFSQIDENDLNELIDNKTLIRIIDLYRRLYREGNIPSGKDFLYSNEPEISSAVVELLQEKYEVSPKWKEHYDGPMPTREDLYREEVTSSLNYLKLRKIKRLIEENQRELQASSDPDHQLLILQTHHHLKQLEMELTKAIGTVIYK